MFYKNERIGVFVDAANLSGACRSIDLRIDFRKFLKAFQERGVFIRCNYYTAIIDTDEHNPIRKLVDWLEYNGYNVCSKPAKEYYDAAGNRRVKGNVDVDIAVDMIDQADGYDHIILCSGDGDFLPLVSLMQRRGKRVSVLSTIKGDISMMSDQLRRKADTFIDLDDIRNLIGQEQNDDE